MLFGGKASPRREEEGEWKGEVERERGGEKRGRRGG
jgi:hypothetical protein